MTQQDIVDTVPHLTEKERDMLKIFSVNPFVYIYKKTNLLILVATLITILLFVPYTQYIPIFNLLLKPLVFSATVLWIVNTLLLLLSFTNSNFSYLNIGFLTQMIILIVVGVTSILYYTIISPPRPPPEDDLTKEKLLEIKADYGNVMSEYLYSKNIPSEKYDIVLQEYKIFEPFKKRTTQKIKSIKNLKEKANILYNFRPPPPPNDNLGTEMLSQLTDEQVIERSLFIQSFNVIKAIDSKLLTLGWTPPSILSTLPVNITQALVKYDNILGKASEITNNIPPDATEDAYVKKHINLAVNSVKLLKKLGDQENSEGEFEYATSLYGEIFNKLKSVFCQKKPTNSELSWSTIIKNHSNKGDSSLTITREKIQNIRTLLLCSNNDELFSQKASLQDLIDKL